MDWVGIIQITLAILLAEVIILAVKRWLGRGAQDLQAPDQA